MGFFVASVAVGQSEGKVTYERPGHGTEPVNAAASQYNAPLHKDLAFVIILTTHDRAVVLHFLPNWSMGIHLHEIRGCPKLPRGQSLQGMSSKLQSSLIVTWHSCCRSL